MRGHRKGFAEDDWFLDRLQRDLDRKSAEDKTGDVYKVLGTTRKKVGLTPDQARGILALMVERP